MKCGHVLTKYSWAGKKWAASWFQVNIFGKIFCFFKREILL